jgi:hypothetical protein
MKMILNVVLSPVWALGMVLLAAGTYMVLASEWVCEDLKGFWS